MGKDQMLLRFSIACLLLVLLRENVTGLNLIDCDVINYLIVMILLARMREMLKEEM